MGSNSSSGGGGGEGPANRYQKPPKKKNPIIEYIKGGGIAGVVVRAVKKDYKTRKTNQALLGTSDYQGGKTFSGTKVNTAPDNDGGNNNSNTVTTVASIAPTTLATITSPTTLAKADAVANAPTTVEVSQSSAVDAAPYDSRKTKKKGKSMTILTSSKGIRSDEELTLGKKSLLGA